ncbi:MAG: hypothetical protein WDZ89_00325 [Gemmatimonadota bacterium]
MISESPPWQPFHPERGRLPSELQLPTAPDADRKGQVVLLSAQNHSDEAGWSARAAVRIAREWAAAGSRVFLADLNFDEPVLHTVLGESNAEGMSDALLYGASIQRIAHRLGEGFFFGTAGTVTADADALLRHSGWEEIVDGFLSAGVTLVLFGRDAASGGPFDRVDYRVVLTGASSGPDDVEHGGPGRLLAVLAPGSAPENGGAFEARGSVSRGDAVHAEGASAAGDGAQAQRSAGLADGADAQGHAERGADGARSGDPARTVPVGGTAASTRAERKAAGRTGGRPGRGAKAEAPKKSLRSWLMLALLILIGGVLAAAWLGFIEIPGITPVAGVESAWLDSVTPPDSGARFG